jgi:hypothetical protein
MSYTQLQDIHIAQILWYVKQALGHVYCPVLLPGLDILLKLTFKATFPIYKDIYICKLCKQ